MDEEELLCRLRALVRSKWPEKYSAKTKLGIVKTLASAKEPTSRERQPHEYRQLRSEAKWPKAKAGADGC